MNRQTCKGRLTHLLLLAALTAGTCDVWAHTDEWFDNNPTPHGGQVRMSGPYHLELVIESKLLRVYVTDHADNGIPTAGWTGQAIVLAGGKKSYLELKPAGDNLLQAEAGFPDMSDMKAVVTVQPKADEEYAARFTPGQRKQAASEAQRTQPVGTP